MSKLLTHILDHEENFKGRARLASLFSDFSTLKTTNPDGYNANIFAWRQALINASRSGFLQGGHLLTMKTGRELEGALESRTYGRPLAINAVVKEMEARREIVPVKDFLAAKTGMYRKSWIPLELPTAWQIGQWALRQLGIGLPTNTDEREYVVMATVEDTSKKLLEAVYGNTATATSLIYSVATFADLLSSCLDSARPLTATDTSIILAYITRDKPVASCSGTTIKFALTPSTLPTPVSDHDSKISSLKALSASLAKQVHALHAKVKELDTAARTAVAEGYRTQALSALRSKKLAESTLQHRQSSLDQVDSAISSMDEAVGHIEMVRAMVASAMLLKDLNKEIGGVERVESVMENVREEMADVDDVTRLLAAENAIVDEADVDAELEDLERAQEDASHEKVFQGLPDVPTGLVIARKKRKEDEDVTKRLSDMSLDEVEEIA